MATQVKPKKTFAWDVAIVWFGIIPAIALLELWGIYELFDHLGWIESIRDFLSIEKPTRCG